MASPALGAFGFIGFQLQSGEGTPAAGNSVAWLPLSGPSGFKWRGDVEVLSFGDATGYERLAYSKTQYWAGPLSFYLCPPHAASVVSWILDRDANGQGKWASVWRTDLPGNATRFWQGAADVKVARATLGLAKGGVVQCTLDLVGKALTAAPADQTLTTVAPYITKDCTVSFVPNADEAVEDGFNLEQLTINVDNHVESPAEGMRLNGSYGAHRLYNNAAVSVFGTFTRDYQDLQILDAMLAQNEGVAGGDDWFEATYDGVTSVSMSRGVTFAFQLPRMRYVDWENPLLGKRVGSMKENVQFVGLSRYHGSAWLAPIIYPPISLT